jgi:hypothetical protein
MAAAATKSRKSSLEKEEKPVVLPTKLTEEAVLSRLGKPADLRSIDVYRYDETRCRVNVRRSMDKTAAEAYFCRQKMKKTDYDKMVNDISCSLSNTITLITDSFYLHTNPDGSIRSDSELIERKY